MKDFLLPLIALAGGIFSLFVDAKDKKKRWLFVGGLTLTALITIGFNLQENQKKADALARESESNRQLMKILDNLTANVTETRKSVERLLNFGFTPLSAAQATPQEVAAAVKADDRYKTLLEKPLRFPDVTVEYYPKGLDSETVKKAMETLGLKVTVARANNETPTNAIWVGPSVPDEAVQFVGVTLLRAGAKIIRIQRLPNPTGARASMIQIGAEPAFAGMPALPLEAIEAFRKTQLN